MSDRIEKTFAALKGKRAALIPFIMGYDPHMKASQAMLEALPEAGADIIEIGMPFSDPMADGPVIQAAGLRALAAGGNVTGVLAMVKSFRMRNNTTPIILMGYFNPIYRYGNEKFCKDAASAGVDGLIIVDLPPEEEGELTPHLQSSGLKLIRLIAPTSDDARMELLCKSASGFVYYISVAGITGAKSASSSELESRIGRLREHSGLPIAAGFGIKTTEQVRAAAKIADAVVVGSALVDIQNKSGQDAAINFVKTLAKAL